MRVVLYLFIWTQFSTRTNSFNVRDIERVPSGVINDRARKPARRNEPKQLRAPRLKTEYRDGVLGSIANKQLAAGSVKSQRVGLGSEEVCRILPRADRFNELIGARIDDRE